MKAAPQKYPIGIQHFHKLREDGYLYIDKTDYVYKIAENGGYYFLSRPRRFGKSLLISTLRALYEGRADLFEGLFIQDKWDFSKTNPVIYIPFNSLDYRTKSLDSVILTCLNEQAQAVNISIVHDTVGAAFRELIEKLHQKTGRKAVVLIDEYDKPILDVLDSDEKAEENRAVLKSFYGILKPADEHLQLVFLTGISKFAKVSIFSDLNNLQDITVSKNFAGITGITQAELELHFQEEIEILQEEMQLSRENLLENIKSWYNGYTWDLKTYVYNPFSLLNFFKEGAFKNFWFETGMPTFLVKEMLKNEFFEPTDEYYDETVFGNFDIRNLEPLALLFQTGYVTLNDYNAEDMTYKLAYPNREVAFSLRQYLLNAFSFSKRPTLPTVLSMRDALRQKDLDKVFTQLNALFASLPYHIWENGKQKENFYHAIIHISFMLLGNTLRSEVCTAHGRCDALVETDKYIYAFEFKLDQSAETALQQIQDKGYLAPYQHSGKELIALGVNFSTEKRGVEKWLRG